MTSPSPVKFFFTVVRPSWLLFTVAVSIVGFGALLARADPDGFDQAPALALFFQMFAASTGYRDPLRRGNFDGVLAAGRRRSSIALAHCLVSTALGLATWLTLAGIDVLAVHPSRLPTAMTGPGLASFIYVSTVAWVVSLTLGRYSAGSLWVVSLLAVAATHHLVRLREGLLNVGASWAGALHAVSGALVCPLFLVGDAARQSSRVVFLVMVVAIVGLLVGMLAVARWDAALADRS